MHLHERYKVWIGSIAIVEAIGTNGHDAHRQQMLQISANILVECGRRIRLNAALHCIE